MTFQESNLVKNLESISKCFDPVIGVLGIYSKKRSEVFTEVYE